jgi:hypothetical protein
MREIESELNEEKVRKNQAERKLSAGLEGPLSMKQLTTLVEKVKDPNIRIIIADLISQIFERIDVFPAGTKLNFARLKRMHKVQVRKWGRDDGHVKAYIRDNFDRRKVRFFQVVLNLPGLNQRLCFSNNGSMMIEARLDLAQDLPEDADFGDEPAK